MTTVDERLDRLEKIVGTLVEVVSDTAWNLFGDEFKPYSGYMTEIGRKKLSRALTEACELAERSAYPDPMAEPVA